MSLVRTALRVFLSRAAGKAIVFLGLAALARTLGADLIGTFFLYQALLGVLSVPTDLGVSRAVEKRLSEGTEVNTTPETMLSSAAVLKIGLVAVAGAGIGLAAPLVNDYVGRPVAAVLVLGLALQEARNLSLGALRGENRVDEAAAADALGQAVWAVVAVALVVRSQTVWGIIVGLLVGHGVTALAATYRLEIGVARPSVPAVVSLLQFSVYSTVSSVGGKVYAWTDVLVIGWLLTTTAVGAYEIAWRITAVVLLFSRAVGTTIFPEVSALDARGADDRVGDLIERSITPSLYLVVPALFGGAILARPGLTVVFGAEYAVAALAFSVLMIETTVRAVQVILYRALEAVDRPDLAARAMLVAIVLNAVTNVALVEAFGLVGAAAATTVSFGVAAGMKYRSLSRVVTFELPVAELASVLVSAVGMTAVLIAVREVVVVDDLPTLLGVVTVGIAVYGSMTLVAPPLRQRIVDGARQALDSAVAG